MKAAIIVSEKDPASMNIKGSLLSMFNFKLAPSNGCSQQYQLETGQNSISLYTIPMETVHSNRLDREIEADVYVFAARHSAKAGIKTFCVHAPGNWGSAGLGGIARNLCISSPFIMKQAFLALNGFNNIGFEVTMESTHHGPYIEKPCFFIEIGSTKAEWEDKDAAGIAAKSIIKALAQPVLGYKAAIGIGGTHYASNFNKTIQRTDIAFGHICPKYALGNLDEEMLMQAINKTGPRADFILLDWKGMGREKERVLGLIKKTSLEFKRADKI